MELNFLKNFFCMFSNLHFTHATFYYYHCFKLIIFKMADVHHNVHIKPSIPERQTKSFWVVEDNYLWNNQYVRACGWHILKSLYMNGKDVLHVISIHRPTMASYQRVATAAPTEARLPFCAISPSNQHRQARRGRRLAHGHNDGGGRSGNWAGASPTAGQSPTAIAAVTQKA